MSIFLPTTPGARSFHIDVQDWGGLLTPGLGGAVQRINRIGTRYAMKVELPPLLSRTNGRIWSTALTRAMQVGAQFRIPNDGLVIGSPGNPLIGADALGGTTISLKNVTPGYVFSVGQWVCILVNTFRLHAVAAPATASGAGTVTLTLATPLRAPVSNGFGVEVAAPLIEGFLTDVVGWDTMLEPYNTLSFTIAEAQ